jgi:hypothetical protein
MNLREYNEKHNNGALSNDDWEQLAQRLLNAKFDREKQAEWAGHLAKQGISRSAPAARRIELYSAWKLMAAASVLIVLASVSWYFFLRSPLSAAQQMAGNYLEQPFRLNQGNTRGEDSIEKNRGKAYEAFDNKQYEKAVQYLQIVESNGQAKSSDFFQTGLCLMYQKHPDYPGAIRSFKAARQLDPAAYTDEINWFSGLCYLMIDDKPSAENALKLVVDSPSSRNRDAAVDLLKALKK